MARYPSSRIRGRHRNQIYVVLALLIVAVVIGFIYKPGIFKKGRTQLPLPPNDVNIPEVNATTMVPVAPQPRPEPNLAEIPQPTGEANPEVAELINETLALLDAQPSKIIQARDRLNKALSMPMSGQQQALVKEQLSTLADKWLFSPSIFPEDNLCSSYQVKPGDQLRIIGKQFKVPWEILMEVNNIPRPDALRAGETIKVIHGPFHAKVYRSTFTMDLYLQKTFVRSFPVGLGKPDRQTPTGLWVVKPGGKMISPIWTDPDTHEVLHPGDPNYPLGSRWIELKGVQGNAKSQTGFGIHGTEKPHTIGSASSRGCIRLHNGDAILLYNLLVPTYSQVEILD